MKKPRWMSVWLIGAGIALFLVSRWAWHKHGPHVPLERNPRQAVRR
jgi:hypothetical protein